MAEDEPGERALPTLWALIDAIDRDTLQLFARRMALVSEIASQKRTAGIPIRDMAREQQVLADRRAWAKELGLPIGTVEAVYRLLLVASRDRQAALRTAVPADLPAETVAIIGGKGGMGRLLERLFSDLGHAVLVADLDTDLTPKEAAQAARVVIVSVPIDETDRVIREVGPCVAKEGLLMDVTSVKQGPVKAMLENTTASVVGTHPMFGPGVHSLVGQRVVLCPARGERWLNWTKEAFRARGMLVTESTPEAHDRAMAVVQVLTHYQTQVLGLALARLGVNIDETLAFTSPSYLLELYVCARHFAQSSDLYGAIEMNNPRLQEITEVFRASASSLAEVLSAGDRQGFSNLFEEVREMFGPFTREAQEQSTFLIDRLVELTMGELRRDSARPKGEPGA